MLMTFGQSEATDQTDLLTPIRADIFLESRVYLWLVSPAARVRPRSERARFG
jgi:hypothetical protein